MARISLPELATMYGVVTVQKSDAAWGIQVEGNKVVRYADSVPRDELVAFIVRLGLRREHQREPTELELATRLRSHGYPYRAPLRAQRLLRLHPGRARSHAPRRIAAAE